MHISLISAVVRQRELTSELDQLSLLDLCTSCPLLTALWARPSAEEDPLGFQHRHRAPIPWRQEGKLSLVTVFSMVNYRCSMSPIKRSGVIKCLFVCRKDAFEFVLYTMLVIQRGSGWTKGLLGYITPWNLLALWSPCPIFAWVPWGAGGLHCCDLSPITCLQSVYRGSPVSLRLNTLCAHVLFAFFLFDARCVLRNAWTRPFCFWLTQSFCCTADTHSDENTGFCVFDVNMHLLSVVQS